MLYDSPPIRAAEAKRVEAGVEMGSTGRQDRAREAAPAMRGMGAGAGIRPRWMLGQMLGRSAAMERLFLRLRYLSRHLRIGVLEGEAGTGKRLAAETLHALSARGEGAFRNDGAAGFFACSAATFFVAPAVPLAQAAGGVLYLSNIDELGVEQQRRALEFIGWFSAQARRRAPGLHPSERLPRFGMEAEAPTPPRMLLAGSRRSLRTLVLQGQYSAALQQALYAVHLVLPPLRDRREDIALLAEAFLAEAQQEAGRQLSIEQAMILPSLLAHAWPGNVAALRSVLFAAVHAARGTSLGIDDLALPRGAGRAVVAPGPVLVSPLRAQPESELDANLNTNFDANLDRVILRHIEQVLDRADGNKLRAARLLGISRSTLYRLLKAQRGRQIAVVG